MDQLLFDAVGHLEEEFFQAINCAGTRAVFKGVYGINPQNGDLKKNTNSACLYTQYVNFLH